MGSRQLHTISGLSIVLIMIVAGCSSPSESPPSDRAEPPPASAEPIPTSPPEPDAAAPVEPSVPPLGAPPEPNTKATTSSPTGDPQPEGAPAPAEPGADGKSFTVVARLVDRGRSTPACGRIHAVAVMKLEVVRVEDGRFTGDTLYIYVSCPDMLPSKAVRRLEEGATYRMVLDTRIHRRTAGAKFDAFTKVDAPRYRLMRVLEQVTE